MSDRSNMIYFYDGSFDGLMCCIFESVYRNERPAAIREEADGQESLFEARKVETDENRAQRVKDAIKAKISKVSSRLTGDCAVLKNSNICSNRTL